MSGEKYAYTSGPYTRRQTVDRTKTQKLPALKWESINVTMRNRKVKVSYTIDRYNVVIYTEHGDGAECERFVCEITNYSGSCFVAVREVVVGMDNLTVADAIEMCAIVIKNMAEKKTKP